ncbi:flagellar hook-associated protein FlgL [Curvibacter sp. APW13]|uniref:flagellar hook-associated protein FlgL n=1 Tax=Curvibacter sp. APW13 TaxID=3077236 RepID=UPI0028DD472D|nr:flagellar hook-associated protein FlgL [Curvibacter sp. APW13]MDT8993049.1 flagellar hook-associated protein FlgL [Curvibacter sp. APW13]
MPVNNARMGFSNAYDNVVRTLTTRQSQLATLQENLTSGKRVLKASDDPTAAAQAERSLTRLARIAADQRALEAQKNTISVAESTLGDVTDALQRFRELTVNAGSATLTASERKTIAVELTGLREQILSYANRKDNNGQPLFAALGSAQSPFSGPQPTVPGPDYQFQGLPGAPASSETAIPAALDGESAFMLQTQRDGAYNVSVTNSPAGYIDPSRTLQTSPVSVTNNSLLTGLGYTLQVQSVDTTTTPGTTVVNYSLTDSLGNPLATTPASYPTAKSPATFTVTDIPGMSLDVTVTGTPLVGDTITLKTSPSIFSVLDDAIRDIGGAVNGNAAAQAVGQALNNIDIGMGRINAVRGIAGDLLNRADRIGSNQELRSVQLEADRSRAEDLDMIKGVSDFQNQQTGYQAALQSYAQVQKLSLFNFLS